MNIGDLKIGDGDVTLIVEVAEVKEVRSVKGRDGKTIAVRDVVLKDATGTIPFTLWEGNVDMVRVGDKIAITDGYVREFAKQPMLSLKKSGTIEVVKKK